MRSHCLTIFASVILAAINTLAQSPPPNDNFANRTVISGTQVTFSGTLVGATRESGEDDLYLQYPVAGGTVWWTWTAPQSSTVVVEILGDYSASPGTAAIFAYSGSDLGNLTFLDMNNFDPPAIRYIAFQAAGGQTYQFAAIGSLSQPFTLRLAATNPPLFLQQPQDCAVEPYGSAIFSATATGKVDWNTGEFPNTVYQWSFNGVPIPGEIYPSLVIHNATTNHAGAYSCVASNAGGMTQSAIATLTVAGPDPTPRLTPSLPTDPYYLPLTVTGLAGQWYKVEVAADLQNWNWMYTQAYDVYLSEATTNYPVPSFGPNMFVRARIAHTQACIANLKLFRHAQDVDVVERSRPAHEWVYFGDFQRLLPPSLRSEFPSYSTYCPEGGTYTLNSYNDNPQCSLESHGHKIQ